MTTTSEAKHWDDARFARAVDALSDVRKFMATAEGLAFYEQLQVWIAPPMCAWAAERGHRLEAVEVVNLILVVLGGKDGVHEKRRQKVIFADSPQAYTARIVQNELRREIGTMSTSLSEFDQVRASILADPAERIAGTGAECSLDEAVMLSYAVMAERTPDALKPDVLRLLGWMTANPPQRLSYEKHEREAAGRYAPFLTNAQVKRVFALVYGTRPERSSTSLVAAFLLNPEFDPFSSFRMVTQLTRYSEAMRVVSTKGAQRLIDR